MSDQRILDMAAQTRRFFADRAKECGIVANPTLWDDRVTILAERLYDETADGRAMHIVGGKWKSFDSFTKKTGLDFEIELLVISVPFDDAHATRLPVLWDAYVRWLHKRENSETLLADLNSISE